ncbi:LOW QUALITY PROTEIN: hypothetical protein ACHAXR_003653 [Thalassiosira sp. AJA248-18]
MKGLQRLLLNNMGEEILGGFIGSEATKEQWLMEMVEKWVTAVQTFAQIASRFPQTVYCGFTFCLQNECVVADTAPFFAPFERTIRNEFIPAVLGCGVTAEFRTEGWLGHPQPSGNSFTCPQVDASVTFDFRTHCERAEYFLQKARKQRLEGEQDFLDQRAEGMPAVKDLRNCSNGVWITIIPSRLNGTGLSADECQDSWRLRYNLAPLEMPQHCDGCSARMTVKYALSCTVGGLVHIRHDDVADEFQHLSQAPNFSSANCQGGDATTPTDGDNSSYNNSASDDDEQQPSATAERGDASCHGFWKHGRTCIFDVQITDTDVRSQRNKDVSKILAKHGKEKKDKYLRACHEMRKDFTPLVYSVDSIAGREAKNAERRITTILSGKWQRPYSEMRCNFADGDCGCASKQLSHPWESSAPTPSSPSHCWGCHMWDWRTWPDR